MKFRVLAAMAFVLISADKLNAQESTLVLEEMSNLADAMNIVYLDTTFYTTIENLDDTLNSLSNPEFQYINDSGGALVLRPHEGILFRRFLTGSQWLGPYLAGGQLQDRWEGPTGDYEEGTLIDLYGISPYYFYSPLGLIEPRTGDISLRLYGDFFDRYTIVSHGPDGIMSADDLFWQFGTTITVATISSARLRNSLTRGTAPLSLVIKGYNLGAAQNGSRILYDGVAAENTVITNWSPTEIVASVNSPPPDGVAVSIEFGTGGATRSVALLDERPTSDISDWSLY